MAKTKTKPKKPKVPSVYGQAESEMEAKYGPQIAQAQGLLGQAADTLKSDISTAKNNAAAFDAYAEAAKPNTIERFKAATAGLAPIEANTASALQGTGPAADIFRRAITGTQQAQRAGIVGAGARAEQSLSDRQTAAQAGRISAIDQARTDYKKTQAGVTSQIGALKSARAADTVARFGQLAEAQANRQADIDIATIGADARRDVATTGAKARTKTAGDAQQTAAEKAAAKKREADQKRIGGKREKTGDLKISVENAINDWGRYETPVPRKNKDKETAAAKPYLNDKGNPVSLPRNAQTIQRTPAQVRAKMRDEGYDEGTIHIALLRRVNKPLDAAAIKYLKSKGVYTPREWLPLSGPRDVIAPAGSTGGPGETRPT